MTVYCQYPRAVHVISYTRRRFGKTEHVREHCRSYPNQQLSLDLGV